VIICAAGDIHGAIDRLYEDVLSFEAALGVRFEWVLHVGDFGVWPDPNRIDKATKKHDGAGDFPVWFAERRTAPRKTLFIKGNHEDFDWLDAQSNPEGSATQVLPRLFYLPNGRTMDIGEAGRSVRIGGVGGCFAPSDFDQSSKKGYAKRHYTSDEIETLCKASAIDILLIHDAPAGVKLDQHRVSEAAGLDRLVAGTRPRVCFFGHHHTRIDAEVAGVRCIGLNKVRMPGNLVAIDFNPRGREWSILGEWPSFAGRELKK
jgi:predicted phosphodiesterase